MERAEAEVIYEQGREAVVAVLLALSAQVAAQDLQIAKLAARVAELEQRLNRNSRNSSTPPSQDPPGAPPRPRQAASGRRAGAQPGHPGRGRRLAPIEAVDELIDHWPQRCRCGHRFGEAERCPVGKPARHQVAELPSIAILLSEHRLHRLRCPDCGAKTRAELPASVPRGAFGARLQAAVATLAVRNRVSRRDTVELMGELFGAELSTGSIDAIVQHAGTALEKPYAELLRHIRAAPAINVDETGWRLRGGKRTLWGALTLRAAVFRIAPDRHEREARALLGEHFAGIACSDRWWAYNYLAPEQRQFCSRAPGARLCRP
jgi:transposase